MVVCGGGMWGGIWLLIRGCFLGKDLAGCVLVLIGGDKLGGEGVKVVEWGGGM